MRGKSSNIRGRVTEWAKEYGKHFCIHDLIGFFDSTPQTTLSSTVGWLERDNALTRAFSKETCKMSSKRHAFWIYNTSKAVKPPLSQVEPSKTGQELKKAGRTPRGEYRKWTSADKAKIRRLKKEGMTTIQIGDEFGVSRTAIYRLIERFKKAGKRKPQRKMEKRAIKIPKMPKALIEKAAESQLRNVTSRIEKCVCGKEKLIIEIEL